MDDLRGVILSLCTAASWAVAPVAFAAAGRRIGAFRVNLLRIALATIALTIILVLAGVSLPSPPVTPRTPQVMWLAISGICGMAIGDAAYYASLVLLGPRRALQLLTLSPVGSALLAWAMLGETLRPTELAGIGVVLTAIAYAIYVERAAEGDLKREPGQVSPRGVICGVLAALFGGAGAVLARQAFTTQPDLNPLAATTVRVGSAAIALWLVPLFAGGALGVLRTLKDTHVRSRILIGTLAGPITGMLCYVAALKYAKAGTVSTLSSMSPIMVIPLVAWRYKTRVRKRVILAAVVAVAGVALISWKPATKVATDIATKNAVISSPASAPD
jgi:drug/metabolite transporter (DMT)-like permease